MRNNLEMNHINQSTSQPINKSASQPVNHSTIQPVKRTGLSGPEPHQLMGTPSTSASTSAMATITAASLRPRTGDALSSLGIRLLAAVKQGSTRNPANQ